MRDARALAEEKNRRTADRFEALLRMPLLWRGDGRVTLTDLVCSALHYCRERGISFDDVWAEARVRFESDIPE